MTNGTFEWDHNKNDLNIQKHGISFFEAQEAFLDPHRVIAQDIEHSVTEHRFYCFGRVGEGIMTVRFIYKDNKIRIFGAGYWRKGRKIYEEAQS
jgi:uncharacterized protein